MRCTMEAMVSLSTSLEGGEGGGVARGTWHLSRPYPGAGWPWQGRPHRLQVRQAMLGATSSTEAAEDSPSSPGSEGVGVGVRLGVDWVRAAW